MGRHTARPAGSSTHPWADCRQSAPHPEVPDLSAPMLQAAASVAGGGRFRGARPRQVHGRRLRGRRHVLPLLPLPAVVGPSGSGAWLPFLTCRTSEVFLGGWHVIGPVGDRRVIRPVTRSGSIVRPLRGGWQVNRRSEPAGSRHRTIRTGSVTSSPSPLNVLLGGRCRRIVVRFGPPGSRLRPVEDGVLAHRRTRRGSRRARRLPRSPAWLVGSWSSGSTWLLRASGCRAYRRYRRHGAGLGGHHLPRLVRIAARSQRRRPSDRPWCSPSRPDRSARARVGHGTVKLTTPHSAAVPGW